MALAQELRAPSCICLVRRAGVIAAVAADRVTVADLAPDRRRRWAAVRIDVVKLEPDRFVTAGARGAHKGTAHAVAGEHRALDPGGDSVGGG